MRIDKRITGTINHQEICEYTFTNAQNHRLSITNIGGALMQWIIPDKHGNLDDILLGVPQTVDFLDNPANFGCLIGRYGNRIRNGRFNIGSALVQVSQNLNGHCLHGGFNGFGKKIWSVMDAQCENGTAKLVLQYCSPHLEEGFPGNLSVTVTYSFDEYGKLTIMYTAQTDQDTAINLTSHPYFNLNGQDNSNILQHELYIDADYILEVDDQVLPTGHKISVEGTAFDFKNFKTLGENIHDQDIQLELANGYDHNFIVNSPGDLSRPKAILKSSNGRELRVFTTEPGIQLYTGNWLENVPGKNNFVYHQFGGVCLETQHFPDSPNQPHFPSTKLKSGEVFQSTTIYHPVA